MLSDQVLIALVSAGSGVAIAYIVNVLAKKEQARKAEKEPKDRMEQMFDGYERLIKQKDAEDDRKMKSMKALEEELIFTRQTVLRLEKALEDTQEELEVSRAENRELREMLKEMRKEYQTTKHHTKEIEDVV